MSMRNRADGLLVLHDALIILVSIGAAVVIVQSGAVARILASVSGAGYIGSFIAGLFFTSLFTTAPAIAALGEIARVDPLITTALIGGLGAVVGDLLIFRFVRDRFAVHLVELMKHKRRTKRFAALFRLRLFRLLSFFVGGLIIASPLPDELGIGFFAFSKMSSSWFIPLSFVANSLGILLIGLVARTI